MSTLGKSKLIKSSFWQIANMGTFAIQNFIFLMIMARMVHKEAHGVFVLINIFIIFVTMLAEGGTSAALIQRKSYNEKHLSIAFYLNIVVSFLIYGLIFLMGNTIVSLFNNNITLDILYITGLNLLISNIGMVSYSLLIKEFDFKALFILNNGSYFITHLVLGTFMAFMDFGVWVFIYSILAYKFLWSLSFMIYKPHSFKFLFGKKEFFDILYFGASYTIFKVLHYFAFQLDKLFLQKFVPLTTLANYEKGLNLTQLPGSLIGNGVDPVLFSFLSSVNGNKDKIKAVLGNILMVLLFLTIYISINFLFFTKSFIVLILGPDWFDADIFIKVFAVVIPLQIVVRVADIIIRSKNKMFFALPIKIFYIICLIGAFYIGKTYGILAFAQAVALTLVAQGFLTITLSYFVLKINWRYYLKFFVAVFLFLIGIIIKNSCCFLLFKQMEILPVFHYPLALVADILIITIFFKKILKLISFDEIRQMIKNNDPQ